MRPGHIRRSGLRVPILASHVGQAPWTRLRLGGLADMASACAACLGRRDRLDCKIHGYEAGCGMRSFEVRVFAIRRRPGRRAFEVRWRVAGRDRSKSFATRRLADSYRAELVRAARKGTGFDPATGEPATWNLAEPAPVSWYQHAVAYAQMKWP